MAPTHSKLRFALPILALLAAAPAHAQQPATVEGHALRPTLVPFDDARLARLKVPTGFAVSVFARDLEHPRMLAVDGDGAVYVTRPNEGDVVVLRPDDDGKLVRSTLVSGLPGVHGIALRGREVFLATPQRVVAVSLDAPAAAPRLVLDGLPDGAQHPNRSIAFGPDGALYVSVGSSCNACVETNPEHATLLRADAESGKRSTWATGLRNTIGFDWHPKSGALFGMDHGTDWLGDDTPPEELNEIREGKDYGWPFCFADRRINPNMDEPKGRAAERADTKAKYCEKSEPPALGTTAHAAPIAMLFYDGKSFPEAYQSAAFVALHGSWNRAPASGFGVAAIHFEGDRPVRFEEFLTGFLLEDGTTQFGRPAGLAVAPDGALLVSDDANGVIYRVSYGSAQIADR
jgi:glucose/arabinose dehydrogenase